MPERRTSVAGAVAEVLAEDVGEVRHRRKAASGGDVGTVADVACCRRGQQRVGEVQAAGQDVPRDRGAVGGEDPGQLPLTDPDRRRDFCGAQPRVGQDAPLYRSVRRRGARSPEPRRASGCSTAIRSSTVRSSAGRGRSVRAARLVILASVRAYWSSRAVVMERCDDWPAELGTSGSAAAIDLDDEFLEAVPEPSREGLVRIEDEDVSWTQRVRPVRALEPGVPAQRQVDRDRVCGAALDDFSWCAGPRGRTRGPGRDRRGEGER